MISVSRASLVLFPSLLCALACGGGGPSGHSAVAPETMLQATTAEEKADICRAHVDYYVGRVDSADTYCRWRAQANSTGTTDEEVQLTCALEESQCLMTKEEQFANATAMLEASCDGSAPFTNLLLREYATCPASVGQFEDCGIELIDTLAELRSVPCSEFTVARRNVINMDYSGQACEAIACF